jgi:glutamate formiminotransferase/formiminotetrahydrofolate cyclodeaminase
LRRGEYEGLARRLLQPEFAPDFGPPRFNARSGATAIGAREALIAWNVNLDTTDARLAERIAGELRESGRLTPQGRVPGRFRELQARGWTIEEYGRAQVACNLTNYRVTPIHTVLEACREEAAKLGVRVTGSELVGLVPLEAILAAGDHYLAGTGGSTEVPELARVRAAIVALGLGELRPFDPLARILEYKVLRS